MLEMQWLEWAAGEDDAGDLIDEEEEEKKEVDGTNCTDWYGGQLMLMLLKPQTYLI